MRGSIMILTPMCPQCGEELEFDEVIRAETPNGPSVEEYLYYIKPCSYCLQEAEERGYHNGYFAGKDTK